MEYKDYYKIMGVERSASADELKKAHRKLARKYHPDVSQEKDAEARFKDLSEAYEVLRDPEKRAAYDQLGAHWKAGQDFRPPPDWNAGSEHAGRGFDWGFKTEGAGQGADFSDFFESLFSNGFAAPPGRHAGARGNGRSRRPAFSAKGEDHHAKILIDIEDVYTKTQPRTNTPNQLRRAQGHSRRTKHSAQWPRIAGQRWRQARRLVFRSGLSTARCWQSQLPRRQTRHLPGPAHHALGSGTRCRGARAYAQRNR